MKIAAIWAAAALLLVSSHGSAPAEQPERRRPAPDCSDDRGADRCSPEQHRRVLRLFGLEPIETYHASGAQVRRVFFVDGHGRDVLALSFVRAPGRDALMQAHFPRQEGEAARAPLEAIVPEPVWQEVIAASTLIGHRLIAPPPAADGWVTTCLHPSVFTVEATDPAEYNLPARLRRATEDACGDGSVEQFATSLQRTALSLLPYCALLDRRHHRSEAMMIVACSLLSGDRAAAAGALNGAAALRHIEQADEIALVRQAFDPESKLDWQGRQSEGEAAAAAWLAGIIAAPYTGFDIEAVHGLTAGRARVSGFVTRDITPEGAERALFEQASVEQIWVQAGNSPWTIEQATVGPYRRRRL